MKKYYVGLVYTDYIISMAIDFVIVEFDKDINTNTFKEFKNVVLNELNCKVNIDIVCFAILSWQEF